MKKLKILFLIFLVSIFSLFLIDNAKASVSSENKPYFDSTTSLFSEIANRRHYVYANYYKNTNNLYIFTLYGDDINNSSSYSKLYDQFSQYPYIYFTFNNPNNSGGCFIYSSQPLVYNTSDKYLYANSLGNTYYSMSWVNSISYTKANNGAKLPNTCTLDLINGGTTKFYNNGDILDQNGNVYQSANIINTTPEIHFTTPINIINENDEIIQSNITMTIDNYDSTKHIVQYSTSYDYNSDTHDYNFWDLNYNGTSWNYTTNINDTLIVRILDSTNNEMIESATFTFANIVEQLPDIRFTKDDNSLCLINNVYYCKGINVKVLNYNSSKYQILVSENGTDWITKDEKEFNYIAQNNLTYYVQVVERNTGNYVTSSTYTFDNIESNKTSLNHKIIFKGFYYELEKKYKVYALIYNYDYTNYNYYFKWKYGTQETQWEDLSPELEKNVTIINSSSAEFLSYTNGTLYIKIEDKQGNYIDSATYTINQFNSEVTINDTLDNLTINNNNKSIFNIFNQVYNKINNSSLGEYIKIIIYSSILILLIKVLKRK